MTTKNIIDLRQARAKAHEDSKAIYAKFEGKEMPAEDKATMEAFDNEFDAITTKITDGEKRLERERIAGETPIETGKPTDAKSDVVTAFRDYLVTGTQQAFEVYNALSQGNPTQAGYLVAPEKFVMELIKELADATFMRQKARVLPTLQGAQSLGYPTRTVGMSSFAWGTETQAPTPDSTLAYGKREFKPNPATSEILISKTLIRNAPEVDALVRAEIVEEMSENLEIAYMTGNGVGQPLGLFTASNDGIPTSRDVSNGNTATEIKFDGLLEAQYSIKQKYQPNCEWIFHRDAIKQLRKLKDSDGHYVWQPSIQLGQPDILLSKPINMTEYAPSTFTTGLYAGLYGDLKNYWICDSFALDIQVLTELYARQNQIDYITRVETDGAPVMPAAFARVTLG